MRLLPFFIFFLGISSLFAQQNVIDSLISKVDQKEGEELIMLLSDISYYSSFENIELSEKYANLCLDEALNFGDSLLISEGYNAKAICAYRKSDYEESLHNNYKAYDIRKRHGGPPNKVSSLSKIGNCLYELGKYDDAIKYYLRAMKICEENEMKQNVGLLSNNIAEVFKSQENLEKALEYYKKSISIGEEFRDTLSLINTMNNIGVMYNRQKKFEKADSIYKLTYQLIKVKGYANREGDILINLGVLYKAWGKEKQALEYYKKALPIIEEHGEQHGLSIVYSNLGNSYAKAGQLDSAYVYLSRGLEIAEKIGALERLNHSYNGLSSFYKLKGDYFNALYYDSLADVLQDSMLNIENLEVIEDINTRYETAKKEKQLAEQQIEIATQEAQVQRRNLQLVGLGSGIAMMLLIGAIVYTRQRAKQDILHQQLELEKVESLNRVQNEKLRISRDLHDNIGSQLTFVISSLDNMNYIKEEEKRKEKLSQLGDFTKDTMNQLRETIWAIKTESISSDQLISKVAEFMDKAKLACPQINFSINQPDNGTFNLNSNQAINLYRTIQEAVNNAIKHANSSSISVTITEQEICVKDDGKGFDKSSIKQGNGTINMQARMKEVGFRTQINSTPGKGTEVCISLKQNTL